MRILLFFPFLDEVNAYEGYVRVTIIHGVASAQRLIIPMKMTLGPLDIS